MSSTYPEGRKPSGYAENAAHARALAAQVASAIDAIDIEIEKAQIKSKYKLEFQSRAFEVEDAEAACEAQTKELTSQAKAQFLELVARRNQELQDLQAMHDEQMKLVRRYIPYWLIRIDVMLADLSASAANSDPLWRGACRTILNELAEIFAEAKHPATVDAISKLLFIVDTSSRDAAREELLKLREHAHAHEMTQDSAYASARNGLNQLDVHIEHRLRRYRDQIAHLSASTNHSRDEARAAVERAREREAEAADQLQLLQGALPVQGTLPTSPDALLAEEATRVVLASPRGAKAGRGKGRGRGRGGKGGAARGGAGVGTGKGGASGKDIQQEFQRILAQHGGWISPEQCAKYATKYFSKCAAVGAWRAAMAILDMVTARKAIPTRTDFHLILSACKRGQPPDPASAATVLAEMRHHGVSRDMSSYNRVIDVCRATGAWRRALVVFATLVEDGFKPTSATFQLLVDSVKRASRDDAVDVYAAMLAVGIPPPIAYSAAQAAATTGTVDGDNASLM